MIDGVEGKDGWKGIGGMEMEMELGCGKVWLRA